MLDEQREATFIIVDAPVEGILSSTTRRILGELRRSQKAIHPGWIDECVLQSAIADFEPFIVNVPFEPISSASRSDSMEIDLQPVRGLSQAPSVDSLTVKGKRRQSQIELDGCSLDVTSSCQGISQTSTGTVPKATDPRVRPRLSTEVTPTPPSWYRPTPTQRSTPPVTSHPETPLQQVHPGEPSQKAANHEATSSAGSGPTLKSGPPVTASDRPCALTSLSLKPLEGLTPFAIPSNTTAHSFALPIRPVPSGSQMPMDLDTIKTEQPDPTTSPNPSQDDLVSQSTTSALSMDTARARTKPDTLFHGLSLSSHLAARPRAVSPEVQHEEVSRTADPVVKAEDMAAHVAVKIEMMDTHIPSPASSCTHLSGLSSPTSTSIPGASTDVSDSSDGMPPDINGLAPPESMLNQDAPVLSETSRTGSPLSPLPPDLEDDDHFSDTFSTSSSEVSSMSGTTCPSDNGSPPPISLIDDRPRSHSSEIQTLPTVEAQLQPLLVIGGRDEGRAPAEKAKGPPKLVEAARLNEVIEVFHKWLQSPTTYTAAEFVKDIEKKVRHVHCKVEVILTDRRRNSAGQRCLSVKRRSSEAG